MRSVRSLIRLPRLEVQQQEETPVESPLHNKNPRSLRDLYEWTPVIDEQLQYALFFCQPTYFNEAVKDAQWVKSMNEEVYAIEKKQTSDLVDVPAEKKQYWSQMGL